MLHFMRFSSSDLLIKPIETFVLYYLIWLNGLLVEKVSYQVFGVSKNIVEADAQVFMIFFEENTMCFRSPSDCSETPNNVLYNS